MKIAAQHSHKSAYEILKNDKPNLWKEIVGSIENTSIEDCRTKISKEHRTQGKTFFSPISVNRNMKGEFNSYGWFEKRVPYYTTDCVDVLTQTIDLPLHEQKAAILAAGKTPFKSYNQTDFLKDNVAIEVQFGKYPFVAYDISFKNVAFFKSGHIEVAVEIVPMKSMQVEMSSGVGYYEHIMYSMAMQRECDIAVPFVVLGVEP